MTVKQKTVQGTRAFVRLFLGTCIALGTIGTAQRASAAPLDSMIKAVKFDDVSAVRKLLSKGIDPNAVDNQGTPLLVIAAREKSNQVALLLMQDKRTDIEKLDPAGENAMMLAAIAQDPPLVRALIDKGAEVNKKGWAPLHYAASTGNDEIVKMLLEASAYIDAASPNGTTPLMMAARGGFVSTITLLVDQGADPTLKNQLGLTAADFAKRYNETDAIATLATSVTAWDARHAPGAPKAP
jgi:ankyrin repeat protein